jgi:hypothetical protein
MEITVNEMIDLNNRTQEAITRSYEKGVSDEKNRPLPKTLFDALIEYGNKTKTLVNYHKSGSKSDGCNWVQLKPTRTGAKGIESVEISFEENLCEINYVGVNKL